MNECTLFILGGVIDFPEHPVERNKKTNKQHKTSADRLPEVAALLLDVIKKTVEMWREKNHISHCVLNRDNIKHVIWVGWSVMGVGGPYSLPR